MRTINGPAPLVRILSNSQLANLRRTNHYLILDRYGQIDSCSHDIVDVRPTGCLVNACACLPFPFLPASAAGPFCAEQKSYPFRSLSIFQLFAFVCCFHLFPVFFCEKGRIFKSKKLNLARGLEDTPPGLDLDRAAKFADMACELS